jgi:hypothetical protein
MTYAEIRQQFLAQLPISAPVPPRRPRRFPVPIAGTRWC